MIAAIIIAALIVWHLHSRINGVGHRLTYTNREIRARLAQAQANDREANHEDR